MHLEHSVGSCPKLYKDLNEQKGGMMEKINKLGIIIKLKIPPWTNEVEN